MDGPVNLQIVDNLMIDDTEYEQNNTGMMSRIKNFTFIREQPDNKLDQISVRAKPKKSFE